MADWAWRSPCARSTEDAAPLANAAANTRLRMSAKHAEGVLKESRPDLIIRGGEKHIIAPGEFQPTVHSRDYSQISRIRVDPYVRMRLGK